MLAQDVLNVVGDAGDRERLTRTEPLACLARSRAIRSGPISRARFPSRRSRREPYCPATTRLQPATLWRKAMSFHLGAEGAASAVGRIDAGTAEAFRRFLDGEGGAFAALPAFAGRLGTRRDRDGNADPRA